MVGIFDSGLGGLTAVREFARMMPREDVVYFGDTGRVPYGTRSREIIRRYSMQDTRFLLTQHVGAVLVACGTVSSVALDALRETFPDIPFFGVIDGAAEKAVACTKNKIVGVIGTATTIHSGAYAKAIAALDPAVTTVSAACPLFVPLVENNFVDPDEEVTRLVAERYLREIKASGADTLILGCTHFPIIAPILERVLPGVTMLSSGKEAAAQLAAALTASGAAGDETGKIQYYVSDEPHNFNAVAEVFLGCGISENVVKIDIETY